jgi:UDP-N-acetylglucosamine 2-epimerase (non-hydrolysing)
VKTEFEEICIKGMPDIIVVVGDVNSTMACSVTAKKLHIKVAHVEAGLRSGDMSMPEEINRIVTDSISDYLFVTEKSGVENLQIEGKKESQIFFVGNIMIDTLYYSLEKLKGKEGINYKNIKHQNVNNSSYAVVTLHRPSNVDNEDKLRDILSTFSEISKEMHLYFPIHPRTKKNIEKFNLNSLLRDSNITTMPPMSYLDFLLLWKDASLVFTDSGGIQEETTALGIPCFTVRENTERPVTVEEGTNVLVGTTGKGILNAFNGFNMSKNNKYKVPELWDGKTAERIVRHLLDQ